MTDGPIEIDVEYLRERGRAAGSRSEWQLDAGPRRGGLDHAVEVLRYPRAALEALPRSCTERFVGFGNPHRIAPILAGAAVLDHACGSGLDVLLAARRVGPRGRVIGVDMALAMRECAARAAAAAGLEKVVEIREGSFEDLPVEDEGFDYVISNAVLNLAPNKPRVMAEIARVLKPHGALLLADVVVESPSARGRRGEAALRAAGIGSAITAAELMALASNAGLGGTRLIERFDCFRATPLEHELAGRLGAHGVTLLARKPARRPNAGPYAQRQPTSGPNRANGSA